MLYWLLDLTFWQGQAQGPSFWGWMTGRASAGPWSRRSPWEIWLAPAKSSSGRWSQYWLGACRPFAASLVSTVLACLYRTSGTNAELAWKGRRAWCLMAIRVKCRVEIGLFRHGKSCDWFLTSLVNDSEVASLLQDLLQQAAAARFAQLARFARFARLSRFSRLRI